MICDVSIRRMVPQDVPSAMELKEAEHWNQTEEDWNFLLKLNPDLCWVATADEKVVGTVTAINYNNHLSWVGMMLVSKQHRGRGLSSKLLACVLEQLKPCPAVKLDATAEGRFVYTKFGFEDELTIYRMVRPAHQPTAGHQRESSAEVLTRKEIEQVVACDQEIFGANRTELLHHLYEHSLKLAWLIRPAHAVTAYAFSRAGSQYRHIGPLGASDTTEARSLLSRAIKDLPPLPLVVDVLASQQEFIAWLEDCGFEIKRQFVRMYRRENPIPGTIKNQFLIAGPEFG